MPEIIKTPIKIELVHADPWKDILRTAWINSRPNVKADEVNFTDVLKIDTPVSEMAGVVVSMTVPILFREILTNARDHVMWARTSRVDNLVDVWPIIDSVTDQQILDIEALAEDLAKEAQSGKHQDYFRQHIPLGYMTGLTMRFSIRTAIKMVKYFQYLSRKYEQIEDAAMDFAGQLSWILEMIDVPVAELLPIIKMQDFTPTPEWNDGKYPTDGRVGDMLAIRVRIPVSLRAQLIRHRTISVVDTLGLFFESQYVWSTPISKDMVVEVGANVSTWKSIVSKRNCWIAQADLWKPIVDAANSALGSTDFMVPCADGVCPYAADVFERIKRTDPGQPCPRMIALADNSRQLLDLYCDGSSHEIYQDAVNEFDKYALDTGRPMNYWTRQSAELLEKVTE